MAVANTLANRREMRNESSKYKKSASLFEEARKYIPGGVNSNNRYVEPNQVFSRARGSRIWDVDGNEYIDYHAAFGPVILGHNNPKVNRFVKEIMDEIDLVGVGSFELEMKVAKKLVQHVPSAKKVLLCGSGSEATYHAIRVSRAHTKRSKIIKFQGCYHGWHDSVLMNVISAAERVGKRDPHSLGIPPHVLADTIVLDFNDLEAVERAVKANRNDLAAVILELIPHNVGCILPKLEFLKGLRELADKEGFVLIFDEVITGFRHDLGGYQRVVGVTPDLTTFGKAMANGYPIAALAGREDLMMRMAPGGDVFFAGTYNAHPVSVAACYATIRELESGRVYSHIFKLGEMMRKGMKDLCEELSIKSYTTGFGSVFVTYFMDPPVENYTDLLRNDKGLFVSFRKKMIDKGIYMFPVNLKRNHVSAAHTEDDIRLTLEKAKEALTETIPNVSSRHHS